MAKLTAIDWQEIAEKRQFHELLIAKANFIVPATLFFVIYYFALPISVGYFPEVMDRKVWGQLNIAYLFALSQFFMAWIIAALYMRAAKRFDMIAHDLVGHLQHQDHVEVAIHKAKLPVAGRAGRAGTGTRPDAAKKRTKKGGR